MTNSSGFTVEVVKVKGQVHWVVKATIDGKSRYRGCYYKKDALMDIQEWEAYHENALREDIFKNREFYHNFNSAEESGIREGN